MIRLTILFVLSTILFGCNSESTENKKTVSINEKALSTKQPIAENLKETIIINFPFELSSFTKDIIAKKYPGGTPPDKVYGTSNGSVTIGLTTDMQPLAESDLPQYMQQTKESLIGNANVEWIKGEMYPVSNTEFGVIRFLSNSGSGKIYNMMCFGVLNGQISLVSFNCMENLREIWEPKFDDVLATMRVG